MRVHAVAARIDAQDRRLANKLVTFEGEQDTPNDFSIERHDGTVLVEAESDLHVRIVVVPQGKFLVLDATDPQGAQIVYETLVRATGVQYEVDRHFVTERGIEHDTLMVREVSVRRVSVLLDAPEAPAQLVSPITIKPLHAAAASGDGNVSGLASPAPFNRSRAEVQAEIDEFEAMHGRKKVEPEPVAPSKVVVPFRGVKAWAAATEDRMDQWRTRVS